MTPPDWRGSEVAPVLVQAGVFLALGFMLGAFSFVALRLNAALYLDGSRPWQAIALGLVRLSSVTASFTVISFHGAVALLSTLAGFLAARAAVIHWSRAVP